MQTYQEPVRSLPASMASFAVRLMSLNANEINLLNNDNELMRHLTQTHLLMESKLQHLQQRQQQQQHHQQQQLMQHQNQVNSTLINNVNRHQQDKYPDLQQQFSALTTQLNLNLQQHNHQQQDTQQQQHQQLLMSPQANYTTQNYYAQQMALASQVAQMQQQHQQHLLLVARQQQQQQHQQGYQPNGSPMIINTNLNHATPQHNGASDSPRSSSNNSTTINQQQSKTAVSSGNRNSPRHQHHHQPQPALDLRTTPTRPMSALSESTPSPLGRTCSVGSNKSTSSSSMASITNNNGQTMHPKKIKLGEYKKMQQLAERGPLTCANPPPTTPTANQTVGKHQIDVERSMVLRNRLIAMDELDDHDQNRRPARGQGNLINTNGLDNCLKNQDLAISRTVNGQLQQQQQQPGEITATMNGTTRGGKKYKGEFDEPSLDELIHREKELDRPHHYHKQALEKGECACVLGSEFRDKSCRDVLFMIEQWRSMEVSQRIKWKWDMNDLPKDILLSDIKKFEDLRREFSGGQADFGGASKRKPLGIRGTRQFLLILYCLWGHPGRDDPMQRDGYCPHCFAKIKKENEQSTLVRVVNHFNMKHRRGANPRMSPQLDNSNVNMASTLSSLSSYKRRASSSPRSNNSGSSRSSPTAIMTITTNTAPTTPTTPPPPPTAAPAASSDPETTTTTNNNNNTPNVSINETLMSVVEAAAAIVSPSISSETNQIISSNDDEETEKKETSVAENKS